MGLFEELTGKYPLEDVPPLGSCLILLQNAKSFLEERPA